MYLNNDYCYMVYKVHHQELLRESERSRLLRAATCGTTQQTDTVYRIGAAVERLLQLLHRCSLSVREVSQ